MLVLTVAEIATTMTEANAKIRIATAAPNGQKSRTAPATMFVAVGNVRSRKRSVPMLARQGAKIALAMAGANAKIRTAMAVPNGQMRPIAERAKSAMAVLALPRVPMHAKRAKSDVRGARSKRVAMPMATVAPNGPTVKIVNLAAMLAHVNPTPIAG